MSWIERRVWHRSERGATVVLTVLLLIPIFGIAALAVDGGALLARRRSMVGATDAAALAAALSFARGDAQCGTNEGPAKTQANNIARANVATARPDNRSGSYFTTDCTKDTVNVKYYATQPLYFAGILGFTSPSYVKATATAKWELPSTGAPIMPLEIRKGVSCGGYSVPDVPQGTTCTFWYYGDYSKDQLGALGFEDQGGNFQWAVSSSFTCGKTKNAQMIRWAYTGYPNPLNLSNPGPTYVCDEGPWGAATVEVICGMWGSSTCPQTYTPKTAMFPLDDATQDLSGGTKNQQDAIVDFVALNVTYGGGADTRCGPIPPGAKYCFTGTWEGGTASAGGVTQISLVG